MFGHTLHDIFLNLTVDELQSYLKIVAPSSTQKIKSGIISELEGHYKHPAKWLHLLSETEKNALAEAVHNWKGEYKHASFVAKYSQTIEFGRPGRYRDKPLRPIGLFFFHIRDVRSGYFIPSELQDDLKKSLEAPKAKEIRTVSEIPTEISAKSRWDSTGLNYPVQIKKTEYASQFELLNVLNLIQAEKLSVSDKTQLPTASTQKNIDQSLFDGDFFSEIKSSQFSKSPYYKEEEGASRAYAWALLVQGGNLARQMGTKLQLTTKGKASLNSPPHETLKYLWESWVKSDMFDEYRRIEIVRGQTGNGSSGMTDPSDRKIAIEEALSELPPNEWVEVDEFFKFIQANDFDFTVTNKPWDLYLSEKQYGSLDNYWEIFEARYILCILFEYAATLGLIDIAYTPASYARHNYSGLWGSDDNTFFSRYDGLKYIRLNSFGAYCVSATSQHYTAPALEKRKAISILPNLEIVATKELGLADKSMMEFLSTHKSQLVWTLDERKILSSLEEGKQLTQLKDYLIALSGEDLPASVEQFFNDIETRISSLKPMGEAHIITCKDDTIATLIANDTQMKKISVWHHNEYIFVKKNHINDFKRNLKKMGYAITI
jgi:hypothetical protein